MKTIHNSFLCLFAIICLLSCKKENENVKPAPVLQLEKVLTGDKNILLDDMASEVRTIQLETSDKILIKYINKIVLLTNSILIIHGDRCSLFDIQGNYIRDIGRKGEGPGEYLQPNNIYTEGENIIIFDYPGKRLLRYNFDGEFLTSSKIPGGIAESTALNNDIFIGFCPNISGSEPIKIKYFDASGSVLDSIPYPNQYENPSGLVTVYYDESIMYKYNNDVHIKEFFNDTLFTLSSNMEIDPLYILDLGQFAPKEEIRYNLTNPQANVLAGKSTIRGILETPTYLLIKATKVDENRHILWNKKINSLENVSFEYSETEKNIFDKDFFNPMFVSEDKKTFISYEESADLENDSNPILVLAKVD